MTTIDPTGAEFLRRAALSLAASARKATPGPWTSLSDGDRIVHMRDDGEHFDYVVDEPMSFGADAAWIAMMSPAMAQPIVDWLDATATAMGFWAPYREHETGYPMWTAALAVAQQVLGEKYDGRADHA